ncbi:hypothetical protein MFLAVUS_008004 [Mucor flavus]|uniref:Uncharacterized protein n=1 Tax=Mucor flavus TaxID=439312 RepID=A0ABP9Z5W6_9FUNG
MNSLVFLNEDGHGNIYQEDGLEAMDIVDEEGDSHSVKQLVNLESYLKKNSNPVTIEKLDEQDHGTENTQIRKDTNRSKKYNDYGSAPREMFFFYKIQQLLSIRAAALKAGVKESTARNWWRNYEEDPDTFAFIRDAVEELTTKFTGLEIKKSRVHEFMKDECNLTMKKVTLWPEARNN